MNAPTADRLHVPGPARAKALLPLGRPLSGRLGFQADARSDEEEAELEILPDADEGGDLGWFASEAGDACGRPQAPLRPRAPATRRPWYPLFAWGLFFALGIFAGLWHPAWLILLTLPLYGPVRRLRHAPDPAAALLALPYPLLAVFLVLCAGVLLGRWYPSWLLLLTIPLYRPVLRRLMDRGYPDR